MNEVFIRVLGEIMKKISLITVALIAVVLIAGGCAGKGGRTEKKAPQGSEVDLFTLEFLDLNGNPFKLEKGKVTYLTFFASWCRVCAEEVKINNGILEKFGKKGLVVYGVNVGDATPVVKKYISKNGIKYSVVRDPSGDISMKKMGLMGLPLNLVVGADGREIFRAAETPTDEILKRALESAK